MSLALRVLIGLLAGLLLGIVAALTDLPWLSNAAAAAAPLGTLWVNAIRMTVVPLVVSLLITSIAGGSRGPHAGRVGVVVLLLFVLLAGISGALAALAAPPLVARLTPDPASLVALGLSSDAAAPAQALPGFRDWLVNLVPVNPVRAAADGAMLPLVVFSVLLGAALARAGDAADAVITFFRAVRDAMLVLVGWILSAAPWACPRWCCPWSRPPGRRSRARSVTALPSCARWCSRRPRCFTWWPRSWAVCPWADSPARSRRPRRWRSDPARRSRPCPP
jgi:Na+/H+-dicarboxylate symporter